MGLENEAFSFFPFGALFCLTLFSFLAVRVYAIRHRQKGDHQKHDFAMILKERMAKGEIDEKEYRMLKDFLSNRD